MTSKEIANYWLRSILPAKIRMSLSNATKAFQNGFGWLLIKSHDDCCFQWPLFNRIQISIGYRDAVHVVQFVVGWQVGEIVILAAFVIERCIYCLFFWLKSNEIAGFVYEYDSDGMRHWIRVSNYSHLTEWFLMSSRPDVIDRISLKCTSPELSVLLRRVNVSSERINEMITFSPLFV